MNRLAGAASAYLRQHAENPVDWYPWGAEAFTRARVQDRPILLSVGYSPCYWCHVMEREVFENSSIAARMNALFVNVKVDREEYPDLDEIYMVARQIYTREGGWPNHVFLTPDLKPFFAGGTFGPVDSQGRPGFPQVLEWVAHAWTTRRAEVQSQANDLAQTVRRVLLQARPEMKPVKLDATALAHTAYAQLEEHYDNAAGGFLGAPKFPHESYLLFLLACHEHTQETPPLAMVTHTLHRMAAGGIYDHVGGGFHRYAVDKDWMVPHFEKMLYNQALLALAFLRQHRLTQDPYTRDIAQRTLEFANEVFSAPDGGFYAALDAETEGVEGAYYAWSARELSESLSPTQGNVLLDLYTLADIPVFPGHPYPEGAVLHAREPLPPAAAQRGISYPMMAAYARDVMATLKAVRGRRPLPRVDKKILVGWNGLMIAALAEGGTILSSLSCLARAEKAAQFVLSRCRIHDGTLSHIFADGMPRLPALLEDYAYFVQGLLALARATGEPRWQEEAMRLMREARARLWDDVGGGYTASAEASRIVRIKTVDDGALPSPNAFMLHNLLALRDLTGDGVWQHDAEELVDAFSAHLQSTEAPLQHVTFLSALLRLHPADTPPAPRSEPPVAFSSAFTSEKELTITISIKEGWHIQAACPGSPYLMPTQIEIMGEGVEVQDIRFPEPQFLPLRQGADSLPVYMGTIVITATLAACGAGPVGVYLACQPCTEHSCALPFYGHVEAVS